MMVFMAVPAVYAQSTHGETVSDGSYIVNRGIFGVVYKVVVGVGKAVEAVLFGRFGVAGLKDYFKPDRIFLQQRPKY
jgi:hypothetical protein